MTEEQFIQECERRYIGNPYAVVTAMAEDKVRRPMMGYIDNFPAWADWDDQKEDPIVRVVWWAELWRRNTEAADNVLAGS